MSSKHVSDLIGISGNEIVALVMKTRIEKLLFTISLLKAFLREKLYL